MVKQSNDNEVSVKFLLAEHQYFRDSLQHNEEVGEKRVNYFISLTTAMITAFVALMSIDIVFFSMEQLLLITVVAMIGLLIIGWLTMLRILKRNKNTDRCKQRLDLVRQIFRKLDKSEILAESYWPYGKEKNKKPGEREWGSGGLREMIMAMNSIIAVVIIVIIFELLRRTFYSTWIGGYIIIGLSGILAFFGVWKIQKWLVKRNVKKKSKSQEEAKKWEWRVFSINSDVNPWKSMINGEVNSIGDKFKNVETIIRSDCYIDLGSPNAGLKIRGIESNKPKKFPIKMELKILLDKINELEYWKKFNIKPIINPKDFDIKRFLKMRKSEIKTLDMNNKTKQMVIKAIERIINSPNNNMAINIHITKERQRIRALYDKYNLSWQFYKEFISNPSVVIIEKTKGTINIKEKIVKFLTFNLESESFKLLQRFKEKFVYINNDNLTSYSYPNFIINRTSRQLKN